MKAESEEIAVEIMRQELQDKHLKSFFETLENPEDPAAERISLISVVSQALGRLIDVEEIFVKEMMEEPSSDICLGCFGQSIEDHTNALAVAASFNHYLSSADNHSDE